MAAGRLLPAFLEKEEDAPLLTEYEILVPADEMPVLLTPLFPANMAELRPDLFAAGFTILSAFKDKDFCTRDTRTDGAGLGLLLLCLTVLFTLPKLNRASSSFYDLKIGRIGRIDADRRIALPISGCAGVFWLKQSRHRNPFAYIQIPISLLHIKT